MIFQIAVGFVCGVFLLAAIVAFFGAVAIVISKYGTIDRFRTRKKYDFLDEEEYEDDVDEYD